MPKKTKKPAEQKQAAIKVNVSHYVQNRGDGSCVVHFFNTPEDAEEFAGEADERYDDDVAQTTLYIDPKTGKITNPSVRED